MTLTYEEQDYVIVATDENGKQYFIPKDEGNSDYQRYLNPEAEQSTPSLAVDAKEL
jgi:hypothetical protein